MSTAAKLNPEIEQPADFQTVVADIAALRKDFVALMSQMKSGAVNGVNNAAESAIGQFSERAERLYDSVVTQGERSTKEITRQIEERPIMSLLIAFGAGFLASRLFLR